MRKEVMNQVCREYISRHLIDTSEENKVEVDIILESDEDCGLSSLLLPTIDTIYQQPGTGEIIIHITGEPEERDMDEYTSVYPDLLEKITEYFYDYYYYG